MGLTIKATGSYVKKETGNRVFRYAVRGTQKELEEYKQAQGERYREDEQGRPLFFTTRSAGEEGKLVITQNGVVVDMTDHHVAASLAGQFGSNYGDVLASKMVERLTGKQNAGNQPSADPKGLADA